jgi:DNA-binding MarR family transcriptional regulator
MSSAMAGSTNGRHGTASGTQDIIEMTTKILVQLQQDPGRGSSDWPNVTMQQLRVMMILYSEGPTRVSVLAKRLNVSTPTITGILDRLVRQELTYRADDPRDRRVVLNALTDRGRDVIEQLQPLDSSRLSRAVEKLSNDQQKALASALADLVSAVETGREPAG